MPAHDIERQLRQSLEARAQDVQPDPETWNRVQADIRRQRTFRFALAGLSTAAAALVAVVVLPGLIDPPGVVFPGLAQQPDPPAAQEPVPDEGCGGPGGIAAVYSHQGDIWAMCVPGGVQLVYESDQDDRNPVVSPDGNALVFESWRDEHPTLVWLQLATLETRELPLAESPAFAPDGRVAWVEQAELSHPRIVGGQLFGEPEFEITVQHEVVPGPLTVRRLVWDTVDDYLLYETVDHEGDSRVWAVHVETDRHELLEPHEQMYYSAAVGPDGTIAVISHDGLGNYELGYLDRAMLTGAGPSFTAVTRLDVLGDHGDEPFLAPAGYVWIEDSSWTGAERQSWFVGNGRVVWLVDQDGEIVELQGDTQAATVNPAAELGERPDREPVELALQEGLPDNVEVTRRRIYSAAKAQDFSGLHALMVEEFSYSFGGNLDRDEAIGYLRDNPHLLETIADLLEQPHGYWRAESADAEMYVWPREFVESDEYLDYRLAIDADGLWLYFLAGD